MRKGFTLIEILIVISIIGILAGSVTMAASGNLKKARDAQRKADLAEIKKALISARSDCASTAYFPSVSPTGTTPATRKADFRTLSTHLSSTGVKYLKAYIQDQKYTDDNGTYGYEFFPNETDATTNVANVCPNSAGNQTIHGTDKFLIKAKLEATTDSDATKSFNDCAGLNGLEGANNGDYFYVCIK